MLRPACLLPAVRLSPLHRLLTPRSGTKVSLGCLGPATRRSGAYQDGALTRWTGAACSSTTLPLSVQSSLCLLTHHSVNVGRLLATEDDGTDWHIAAGAGVRRTLADPARPAWCLVRRTQSMKLPTRF